MADRRMHLQGGTVGHVGWTAVPERDEFDAAAMEEAMIEAREDAYRALADLDAA